MLLLLVFLYLRVILSTCDCGGMGGSFHRRLARDERSHGWDEWGGSEPDPRLRIGRSSWFFCPAGGHRCLELGARKTSDAIEFKLHLNVGLHGNVTTRQGRKFRRIRFLPSPPTCEISRRVEAPRMFPLKNPNRVCYTWCSLKTRCNPMQKVKGHSFYAT